MNIPQGAANIRIFSKDSLPNDDGSSCRVFMSSSSDPASSAPSTSKISYESSTSKKATTNEQRRSKVEEERQCTSKTLEPEKSKKSDDGKNNKEGKVGGKDEDDGQSVLHDTFEDFQEDNSNHEFLSELEKVQEAIDSFDKDVEFHDEFELQSPADSSGRRSDDRESDQSGEFAELAALVSSDDESVKALSPQPKGDIFFTEDSRSLSSGRTRAFLSEDIPQPVKQGAELSERSQNIAFDDLFVNISPDKRTKSDSLKNKAQGQSLNSNPEEKGKERKGQKRSYDGCEKHRDRREEDTEDEVANKRELRKRSGEVVEFKRELRERTQDQAAIKKDVVKGKPKDLKRELRERQQAPTSVAVKPKKMKGKEMVKSPGKQELKSLKTKEKGEEKRSPKEKPGKPSQEKENVKTKFLKPPSLSSKSSPEKASPPKLAKAVSTQVSNKESTPTAKPLKKAMIMLNSKDATDPPPSCPPSQPSPPSVPRKGAARVLVQPQHQEGRKDLLQNLDMRVVEGEPYLAVSTFSNLFTGFSLDAGRLLPCLEDLGPPRRHLLFEGWTVTHLSFPAARKLLQLASAPRFLLDFLNTLKPRKSYIDFAEFRRAEYAREEKDYFRKTDLADCDTDEFKKLFGLVSHEEASKIRAKAKISKRRMLRAKSDLLKNRSGPEDTGKFLQVKPTFLQLQARKRVQQEEPIVSGELVAHVAEIAQETVLPPQKAPKKTLAPTTCDKTPHHPSPLLKRVPPMTSTVDRTLDRAPSGSRSYNQEERPNTDSTFHCTHLSSPDLGATNDIKICKGKSQNSESLELESDTNEKGSNNSSIGSPPASNTQQSVVERGSIREEHSKELPAEETRESTNNAASEGSNTNSSSGRDSRKAEGEKFTVTQTREMKRKGIQLPRGWLVQGTRKEWRTETQGQVYTYHRIDWSYQAPDGRQHRSLRSALAAVRQLARQARLTQWQLKPGPEQGKGEVGKEYLAMAREEERRFEKDVYSIAGIRPVRKFPGTGEEVMPIEPTEENDSAPIRTSVMKRNPETAATRKHGFSLSKVGEIEGPGTGGWFTSKLECLRKMVVPFSSSSSTHLSTSSSSLKITIFCENEATRGLDLQEYRQRLVSQIGRNLDQAEEQGKVNNDVNKEETAGAQKRMRRNILLPAGWQQRLVVVEEEEKREWVDPHGKRFRSFDLVLSHLELAAKNGESPVQQPEENEEGKQPEENDAKKGSREENDAEQDLESEELKMPFKSKKIALRKRGKSRSVSGEKSESDPEERNRCKKSSAMKKMAKRKEPVFAPELKNDGVADNEYKGRTSSEEQRSDSVILQRLKSKEKEKPGSSTMFERRKSKDGDKSGSYVINLDTSSEEELLEGKGPMEEVSRGPRDGKLDVNGELVESKAKAGRAKQKKKDRQKGKKGITDEKIMELLQEEGNDNLGDIMRGGYDENRGKEGSKDEKKSVDSGSGKKGFEGAESRAAVPRKRPKLKRPTFTDIFPEVSSTASSLPRLAKVRRTSSPTDSVEDLLGDSEEEGKRTTGKDKKENKGMTGKDKRDVGEIGEEVMTIARGSTTAERRGRGSTRTSLD